MDVITSSIISASVVAFAVLTAGVWMFGVLRTQALDVNFRLMYFWMLVVTVVTVVNAIFSFSLIGYYKSSS